MNKNTQNPSENRFPEMQELPGSDTGTEKQIVSSPAEPEGTGDSLEREPNQRPHDLDFHQSEDFTGAGVKGEEEERERRGESVV